MPALNHHSETSFGAKVVPERQEDDLKAYEAFRHKHRRDEDTKRL